MTPTLTVNQIDNGFVVIIFPPPGAGGVPTGTKKEQYCADKNTAATYILQQLIPGATFTPPAS